MIEYGRERPDGGAWQDRDGQVHGTGSAVLDDVAAFIARYLALPSPHALTVLVLWAAHTHVADRFYVTPRLVVDSAEPESGKTRVLELLALLCRRPKMAISTTTAALYRRLAQGPMTVLLDEVDAIFAPKTAPLHEDLRALLNAGYKRGATVDRCVGDAAKMKVQEFEVFAPVALAGLAGRMPATITTRAVTIHMRRRAPGERVEPYRERDAELEALPLKEQLAEWVTEVADELADARPAMPEGVSDRPAEVWEALLAVADEAGGDWPARAREACRFFVLHTEPGELSLGVRLLADLYRLYALRETEQLPTAVVIEALCQLEEAPWGDLYGKPLNPRRLAKELDRYDVTPVQFRDHDGSKQRGYVTYRTENPPQAGLADAWSRYLLSPGTSGTAGTRQVSPVPGLTAVPGLSGTGPESGTGATSDVPAVPDVPAYNGSSATEVTDNAGGHHVRSPQRSVLCSVCGEPLHPSLTARGESVHPTCSPASQRGNAPATSTNGIRRVTCATCEKPAHSPLAGDDGQLRCRPCHFGRKPAP